MIRRSLNSRVFRWGLGWMLIPILCGVILIAWQLSLPAAEDDDLLKILEVGAKMAVSAVQSGKGKVTIHDWHERKDGGVMEFNRVYDVAFLGSKARTHLEITYLRNDPHPEIPSASLLQAGTKLEYEFAVSGNELMFFDSSGRSAAVVQDVSNTNATPGIVYRQSLFHLDRSGSMMPGSGLIDINRISFPSKDFVGTRTKIVAREVINGDECIVVEIEGVPVSQNIPSRAIQLWVDPQKGYAVPKLRIILKGEGYSEPFVQQEANVTLRRYDNGVYFPEKVVRDYYVMRNGEREKIESQVITYDPDFQINTPIDEAELSLKLPSGTIVRNEILDLEYTVP